MFLRYLPDGIPAGAPGSGFLIVATYPFSGAYLHLCWIQKHWDKDQALDVPDAALSVVSRTHRRSVYVAFRGVSYEIEVYDRDPREAAKVVSSGRVRPVTG
jgi:hypothetical protein